MAERGKGGKALGKGHGKGGVRHRKILLRDNIQELKGDEQFKECLDKEQTLPDGANLTGMYDIINSFGSNHTDKTNFCCNASLKCEVMSSPIECPLNPPRIFTQCDSINNSKFCVSYGASPLPGKICGGILGNANPINATAGNCPSPDAIRNTLNSQQTISNKFSWLCCNNENCKVPVSVKFKNGPSVNAPPLTQEAITDCASDEYTLMCFRDKIWTCSGGIGSTISIWPNPVGSCLVQVSSFNSSTPLLPSSPPTTSPSFDDKKGIVIGVLSGFNVVIIITIIAIGFLVKKWFKKHREDKMLESARIFGIIYGPV